MTRRTLAADLLKHLREAGGLVSGEQLSRSLSVSRTAIWKQIAALRLVGYNIQAVTSQGYYLISEPDLLDVASIRSELGNRCIVGQRIIFRNETGSTNADAFRFAEEGAEEGTVILADRQLSGKGRLGRNWESPAGVNLYCSVAGYNRPSSGPMTC